MICVSMVDEELFHFFTPLYVSARFWCADVFSALLSESKVLEYFCCKSTATEMEDATMQKNDQSQAQLFEAILSLKSVEECYAFFQDLCTVAELRAMAQRLEVAQMLDAGMIYNDILDRTGASSATISRVNRALQYGADGYKAVLPRIKK